MNLGTGISLADVNQDLKYLMNSGYTTLENGIEYRNVEDYLKSLR